MKFSTRIGRTLALAALLAAPASFAGLYDAEKTAATSGDLADQDYWWTAFDMTMLDDFEIAVESLPGQGTSFVVTLPPHDGGEA